MYKFILIGLTMPLFFASCSTMNAVKSTAVTATKSVKQFSISDLRPSKVDVVEVRQKDLKEMPLGKERALAFEQQQKRTFWSFIKFEEPTLPEMGNEGFDGSLLPPKEL